jgi:signal transduction histidine kinase
MMDQLNQAQKLKSIGQLAAGIAHEINTPTQYVGDNVRFLHEAFEDMSRVLESYGRMLSAVKAGNATSDLIDEIDHCLADADLDYLAEEIPLAIEHTLDGVGRISKIVKAMKEFSHPGREEKVPTDINKSIESTITVARNEWKYVAEMQTDLDASLPLVPCRPGEFNQVILNMIINAAHAIAEVPKDRQAAPGTIRIATDRVGGNARITISDTGTGIPPEIQSRIFDPFFTTKEVGRGTGQGLAICFPVIVEKHGGTIEVESEVGKGTSFTITLPLNPGDD